MSDEQTGNKTWNFSQLLGSELSDVRVTRTQIPNGQSSPELRISLKQSPPGFGNKHPDPNALAIALNLSSSDLGLPEAPQMQPQIISTSATRHLHVPVRSVEALNSVDIQRDKLSEQLRLVDETAIGLFLFTTVAGEHNKYQARFFSPGMSGEDPATGSAAGPLSAFLYRNGLLPVREGLGKIEVLQGLQVGRACEIDVTLTVLKQKHGEENLDVDLEGSGVSVANGKMGIPAEGLCF